MAHQRSTPEVTRGGTGDLRCRMAAWCWAAAPIRDLWFWLRRSVTLTVCVGIHQFFPLRALAFVRFLRAAFFRHGAGLSPCRRTCALLVSSAVSSSAPCSVACRFFRLPGVGPAGFASLRVWFCRRVGVSRLLRRFSARGFGSCVICGLAGLLLIVLSAHLA